LAKLAKGLGLWLFLVVATLLTLFEPLMLGSG
jgi:hypothetical protein